MENVLAGIRVVEVAQWWFVPAAGAILADWGADVIKVEHPVTGDPQRGLMTSGFFPNTGGVNFMMEQSNRGKRSVGIDLAHPDGLATLLRLVETADIFLTNFLPAARRRLGIDVEHIRAVNPRIVYVRGHGHGARGPDVEKGGYDAASFWSRGGIAHAITPSGAAAPIMQRAALGDSAGAMSIAGGIAAALFRRERTGEASVIDVSLLGTAMWILAPDIVLTKLTDQEMPVFDRSNAPNPIVNSYKTRDGRWLFLNMLQPDRFWPDLCAHLGRPDLVTDARFDSGMSRFMNREACVAELEAIFAQHTLDEWRVRLADVEGVWAPMQSAREVTADPQVLANGYLPEVDRGDGTSFTLVANPVQFDETPTDLRPAPELGQHTEEVLLANGLTWDDLARLKASSAIS
ncbi:MAG TPA: CoA transferase [Candidatus Binatia bacterium]|jgi:crotonobetainyl-CoA:carnitine CoA-transferase CaiB-like acyl-CoA transferase|nr:CoA transferase [Candidatus Binatia bacterium]